MYSTLLICLCTVKWFRVLLTIQLNINHLAWFGQILWHTNHCRLFNAKSCLYTHIKYIYMICKHFVDNILKCASASSFLYTAKCFQVLLYNSHNLTSVICLQTVGFIWLSGVTTLSKSAPGSNGNEGVLHIPQSSSQQGLILFDETW